MWWDMLNRLSFDTRFHVIFMTVFILSLFSWNAHAKIMKADFSTAIPDHFILESERIKNPYHKFEIAVEAYEASDYKSAAVIFMDLAKSGHVSAQYYLAIMFDAGIGVEEDHVQSAMWYQKAAKKGHTDAQYNLAIAYATGEGITQNIKKSIYWMKKSALQGNINSQYNLGLIYIMGKGVKINMEEGVYWWRLAAKNGDSTAQYNLGMMYLEGKGVEADICEATRWWQVSADNGFIQSIVVLKNLRNSDIQHGCDGLVSAR
ncbi:MAG TPA: sel1 repeat family protein [Gammaproteobacteria bacterium]|nr:sel1 repeat family protein [Gammaproteobacteria bacterium]